MKREEKREGWGGGEKGGPTPKLRNSSSSKTPLHNNNEKSAKRNSDGILEHYWGEHIHLGYYTQEERARGYLRKDFKRAKVNFVEKMLEWSGVRDAGRPAVKRILDVGCGIGGTSRLLAKAFPDAQVAGITLSTEQVREEKERREIFFLSLLFLFLFLLDRVSPPSFSFLTFCSSFSSPYFPLSTSSSPPPSSQVTRATQLAHAQGLENVTFRVMDALALEFEPGSFDLVWACESGEHMVDKKRYVEQMARALAPGGTMVIATWCQREAAGEGGADADAALAGRSPPPPLSGSERDRLQFLYDEWAHPYFVSVEEYGRMLADTGTLRAVAVADWTRPTIATWRHSNWVGVFDPWPVVRAGPRIWYRVLREIVTLERMHRAFACGLMVYGMARAVKREEGGGWPELEGSGKEEEEVLSMVAA